MAEIKNTFQGSKMNKDLDDRLIPNGTYRTAFNIQVSNSESDDVGTLQTVLGNFQLTDFGIPSTVKNLEVIGYAVDQSRDAVIAFITNCSATDSIEEDQTGTVNIPAYGEEDAVTLTNITKTTGKNYICIISPKFTGILVEGSFLKFSKLFPIVQADILEDLLFFTDNLNQPRKINIESAIANPSTYYTTEESISVAKYFPYEPIDFIQDDLGYKKLGLVNKQDKYLPPSFAAFGQIYTVSDPDLLILKSQINNDDIDLFDFMQVAGALNSNLESNSGQPKIKVTNLSVNGATELYVKKIAKDEASPPNINITLEQEDGTDIANDLTTVASSWATGHVYGFSFPNPDYDNNFVAGGVADYLKDRFVRFSYRFKFDDGENSLIAPFTQHAFIPKQFGYFIGRDADLTAKDGYVSFMENQVTSARLRINLPVTDIKKLREDYKVESVEILCKSSDNQNIQVVDELEFIEYEGYVKEATLDSTVESDAEDGSGYSPLVFKNVETKGGSGKGLVVEVKRTGSGEVNDYGPLDTDVKIIKPGIGYKIGDVIEPVIDFGDPTEENHTQAKLVITELRSDITYNYNSQQPIKILPEKETTRVSDIVPIKAKAQTIVGNRVVYGNFLQSHGSLNRLDYSLEISDKNALHTLHQEIKAHPNHTVKQNRTYQVGVVLRDKFGRTSNVMLNDDQDEKSSTIYVPYTGGGSNPLEFFGRSIKMKWNSVIKKEKDGDYPGLYDAKLNPTGWYTYQVVVKQKEQDYYNVYVPGSLSGRIIFKGLGDHGNLDYDNESGISHIVLSGDNINKVPRELKSVGSSDTQYGSETALYNIVNESIEATGNSTPTLHPLIPQQNTNPKKIEVLEIKPFRELGDWTMYKGIDLQHLDLNGAQYSSATYIYPGVTGKIDPLYLEGNKNPYVATLKTNSRLGFKQSLQRPSLGSEPKFATKLHVFETAPQLSNIDIFYETSTTGLISDLNSSIETAEATGVLTGISQIAWNLVEGAAVNSDISNNFEVMKGSNADTKINNRDAIITLVKVTDANGVNVTSDFSIVQATPGAVGTSPTFKIKNNKQFVFKAGTFNGNGKFTFVLRATCPDSEGTQISKTFTYDNVRVTNIQPTIYGLTMYGYADVNSLEHTGSSGFVTIKNATTSDLGTAPYTTYDDENLFDPDHTSNTSYTGTTKAVYIDNADLNSGFSSALSGIEINLAKFTHINNGFSTYDSENLSASTNAMLLSGTSNQLKGLVPKIKKATRYYVQFQANASDDDVTKYYFPYTKKNETFGAANQGEDKTSQFKIKAQSGTTTFSYFLSWDPPNESKVKDSDLGNNEGNGFKSGWLFEIVCTLQDAAIANAPGSPVDAGSKESTDFRFHFIIHR